MLILLVVLCNRPVKTQIVYETVKEKINEIVNMPTYTAQAISDAYDKRIYSEDAVIEKFTEALLRKIKYDNFPPKYVDLNQVRLDFKTPWKTELFDHAEWQVLLKPSTHQKLRDLGFKITIIKGKFFDCEDDPGYLADTIKLEWN